ncbi:hypothetical protein ZWY2020_014716 [Hordeum vulgare]|nr:hypothetical protein ZWY2020_014716 [Hordeum vulgare]
MRRHHDLQPVLEGSPELPCSHLRSPCAAAPRHGASSPGRRNHRRRRPVAFARSRATRSSSPEIARLRVLARAGLMPAGSADPPVPRRRLPPPDRVPLMSSSLSSAATARGGRAAVAACAPIITAGPCSWPKDCTLGLGLLRTFNARPGRPMKPRVKSFGKPCLRLCGNVETLFNTAFLEENLHVSSDFSRIQVPQQSPQLKKMVDDKKQKDGKKAELNTTFEIPEDIYDDYWTPDEKVYGKETNVKHKIMLQRIERRWAKEWKEYRYVTPKYARKISIKPPCNRPPVGNEQSAHPSSMVTIEDYPKKKAKYLAKLRKVAKEVVTASNEESAVAATAPSSCAAEASATEAPPKKALVKKSGVNSKSSIALSKQQNPQLAPSVDAMSSTPEKSSLLCNPNQVSIQHGPQLAQDHLPLALHTSLQVAY